MPQWDVYLNPSKRSREQVPYLLDLQSDLLSSLGSRLVAPLVPVQASPLDVPRRLCPEFTVDGRVLILLPQECGPVEARLLAQPVESLRAQAHRITDALDAVISGV